MVWQYVCTCLTWSFKNTRCIKHKNKLKLNIPHVLRNLEIVHFVFLVLLPSSHSESILSCPGCMHMWTAYPRIVILFKFDGRGWDHSSSLDCFGAVPAPCIPPSTPQIRYASTGTQLGKVCTGRKKTVSLTSTHTRMLEVKLESGTLRCPPRALDGL